MTPPPSLRSRRHGIAPVGEMLVSYSANELPTDAIEKIARGALDDVKAGETNADQGIVILSWLLRISIQKLRTIEAP
ncbi:MAG TPA: hypothetical protein VK631_11960 [Solirubrobacteraceae bacterium]|nr:hypothetical protein [Solirubrobacteraceae bacterium]